jgi:hypothetical protein
MESAVRIGITGHINLSEQAVPLVTDAVRDHLRTFDGTSLVGISCLARGSDSVFAEVVLDLGGQLEVVLPSADYRESKVEPDHAPQFDRLLAKASAVKTMPFDTANRDAYAAANEAMLASVDQLVAVWDGQPSPDKGGTAGAVAEATARGIAVQVIWPDGASRT